MEATFAEHITDSGLGTIGGPARPELDEWHCSNPSVVSTFRIRPRVGYRWILCGVSTNLVDPSAGTQALHFSFAAGVIRLLDLILTTQRTDGQWRVVRAVFEPVDQLLTQAQQFLAGETSCGTSFEGMP